MAGKDFKNGPPSSSHSNNKVIEHYLDFLDNGGEAMIYQKVKELLAPHDNWILKVTFITMLKVFLNYSRFGNESDLLSYSDKILQKECKFILMKIAREQRNTEVSTPKLSNKMDFDALALFRQGNLDLNLIGNALALLPPHQRLIFKFRYHDCLSQSQVAELMGVSIGVIKSLETQAIKRLRSYTDNYDL